MKKHKKKAMMVMELAGTMPKMPPMSPMKTEGMDSTVMAALLRPGAKPSKVKEAASLMSEAAPSAQPALPGIAPAESGVFKVVLITEGLGNKRQMNYYGPEAINSAPAAFEGKPCYMDHPSASEDRDLPERSVLKKAGYFKGCHVESIGGKLSCLGELHFDASEVGQHGAAKARAALHYQQEFPGSTEEYVGLSINADGETELRKLAVEGKTVDVNYVLNITEAGSCDLVTTPARGGKFLALVESTAGAIIPSRKESLMIIESLKKALSFLKESKVEDGTKTIKALLAEAEKAVKAAEDEAETEGEVADPIKVKADEAAGMYEKGAALMAQALAMGHKVPGSEPAAEPAAPAADAPAASTAKAEGEGVLTISHEEKPGEPTVVKSETEGEGCDEAMESKRMAVEFMLKEAKVSKDHADFNALVKMKLSEAKAEISRIKTLKEAIAKDIVKKLDTPAGHPAKMVESAAGATSNQGLFSGLMVS